MTELSITELLMFAVSFFTLTAAAYAYHDHSQPSTPRKIAAGIGLVTVLIGVVFLVVALFRL